MPQQQQAVISQRLLFLLISGTTTIGAVAALLRWWRRERNDNEKHNSTGKQQTSRPPPPLQVEHWADIVHFLPAKRLSTGLSLANQQLHQLCAPKMYDHNAHIVNELSISGTATSDENEEDSDSDDAVEGNGSKKEKKPGDELKVSKRIWDSEYSETVMVPVPEVEAPLNIIGFKCIYIRVLNEKMLALMRLFCAKFADNSVPLLIEPYAYYGGSSVMPFNHLLQFHTLLQGKVASLNVKDDVFYEFYWRHCRPFLLSVQFLTFNGNYFEDGYLDIVCAWLQSPRQDGRPRYLYAYFGVNSNRLINRLRELFSATDVQPCSYIVEFYVDDLQALDEQPPAPFTLQNGLNERLIFGGRPQQQLNDPLNQQPNMLLRRFTAMATTIADDWVQTVLNKARQLMFRQVYKFRCVRVLDARGHLVAEEERNSLNEIRLMLEKRRGGPC